MLMKSGLMPSHTITTTCPALPAAQAEKEKNEMNRAAETSNNERRAPDHQSTGFGPWLPGIGYCRPDVRSCTFKSLRGKAGKSNKS